MRKKMREIIGVIAIVSMIFWQGNIIIVRAAEELPKVDETIKQYGNIQYKEVFHVGNASSICGQVGIEIQKILDDSDTVTIPNTIDGKNVVGFSENKIGGWGDHRDDNYFYYIKNIKVINNDPNNKLCAISFYDLKNLENITIGDNIETIDGNCITSLDNLKSVTFPKSIKEIGKYTFMFCPNIETTNIDECLDLDLSNCCMDNTKWGKK